MRVLLKQREPHLAVDEFSLDRKLAGERPLGIEIRIRVDEIPRDRRDLVKLGHRREAVRDTERSGDGPVLGRFVSQ